MLDGTLFHSPKFDNGKTLHNVNLAQLTVRKQQNNKQLQYNSKLHSIKTFITEK